MKFITVYKDNGIKNNNDMIDGNIPEMQSDFERIRWMEDGQEFWNELPVHSRQMFTSVLREFIVKGYVLDDERLKLNEPFDEEYFEDMKERIHEIRISRRCHYQKITDIFSEMSFDYDKNSETTKLFYSRIQSMMCGTDSESDSLNRLSNLFLEMAELRAQRHLITKMEDWQKFLEKFMSASDEELLQHNGTVSDEQAQEKAFGEYDKFRLIQDRDYLSDLTTCLRKLVI